MIRDLLQAAGTHELWAACNARGLIESPYSLAGSSVPPPGVKLKWLRFRKRYQIKIILPLIPLCIGADNPACSAFSSVYVSAVIIFYIIIGNQMIGYNTTTSLHTRHKLLCFF